MLNPHPRHDDSSLSELTTVADQSIQRIYQVIAALHEAGRDDLAIEVRKHLPELWATGSPEMPNPFLLRKLSKDAEVIWLKHEEDKLTATLAIRPSESYVIQRELALKRSEYEFELRNEIKVTVNSKNRLIRFWVSAADSIDEIEKTDRMLQLQSVDDLQSGTRAHILGPQRLAIGSTDRLFRGEIFGCCCTIRRSFRFHSSVEVETEITLAHSAHLREVCAQLKKIEGAETSREIARFIRLLQQVGVDEVLHRAEVPVKINEERILGYLSTYSISRAGLNARFREVRGFYKRLCLESGMSLAKLQLEGKQFWGRLEAILPKSGTSSS